MIICSSANKAASKFSYKLKRLIFIIFLSSCISSYSQDSIPLNTLTKQSFETDKNGHRIYPFNKKRIRLITAANIVGYSAVLVGLNAAWYSQYPKTSFHFFNDNAEWHSSRGEIMQRFNIHDRENP